MKKETVKRKKTYAAPRVLQQVSLGLAQEMAQGQFVVTSASINEYDVRGERQFEEVEDISLDIRTRNLWEGEW